MYYASLKMARRPSGVSCKWNSCCKLAAAARWRPLILIPHFYRNSDDKAIIQQLIVTQDSVVAKPADAAASTPKPADASAPQHTGASEPHSAIKENLKILQQLVVAASGSMKR